MRMRAYVSVFGVAATAVLSAAVLWWMLFVQGSLGHLGLAGLFLASMLSHLTIVARDMFVPVFLPLTSVYSPLLLGASAGWGGAIGEVTAYVLGWGVAESVMEKQSVADDRVARWIRRYGLLAVLLVSVTPLPDTPVILFAGSRQLPFKKLLLVEGVGKTAYYTLGAFVGGFVFTGLTEMMGGLTASLLVVAASVAFCVMVTWGRSRAVIYGWAERLMP
ncbi:hypothetical protein AC482_00925 [miscellaneous Crenarchaeota group-15 archaeon DG-45]|uniref:VTT domain-containing protein n=1 Tax=miscellaneous Crenarchaeota group-15 archaeon DG-45 TaxID=1685127 RepID=A0A0M0BSK8_9ARCH|nr:MAG: hypothetical protein AC482_00925 [miscellaneous Crenarchaeota group-15 archaeon DG-45]